MGVTVREFVVRALVESFRTFAVASILERGQADGATHIDLGCS